MAMYDGDAQMGSLRQTRSETAFSVGSMIDVNQVMSTSHPKYRAMSDRLSAKLRDILARETERRASSEVAVCSVILDIETKAQVEQEYPEFRIQWLPLNRNVHVGWVARRQMINQYLTMLARKYASSVVHYGGAALQYMVQNDASVHLEVDMSNVCAAHDNHQDLVDVTRTLSALSSGTQIVGLTIKPESATAYMEAEAWRKCSLTRTCSHSAEALIVDLSMYTMSPLQFMAAMSQHSAIVGYVAVPYHSSMFLHPQGTFPGTDVDYDIDESSLRLRYAQGVSGVTVMSTSVWHQWHASVVRFLETDVRVAYQFELMVIKGPFLVVRVVKLDTLDKLPDSSVHALELPGQADMTFVKTWALKDFSSNPNERASWQEMTLTVPTRIVEKVHDYAMALPVHQFTRHAIRKRLSVVNDRVIVQGTNVEVHEPLSSDTLDFLETAIFVRCFVARYEVGRLSSHLQSCLDDVIKFSTFDPFVRMSWVFVTCVKFAYDWTLGAFNDRLRQMLDSSRSWLGIRPTARMPTFSPAPTFIKYEHVISSWFQRTRQYIDSNLLVAPSFDDVSVTLSGAFLTIALNSRTENDRIVDARRDKYVEVHAPGKGHVIINMTSVSDDYVDVREPGPDNATDSIVGAYAAMSAYNDVSLAPDGRHIMRKARVESIFDHESYMKVDYTVDPGYIDTITDMHEMAFPGMSSQDFLYDSASLSIDDQDRTLAADYLKLPTYYGDVPPPKYLYPSKIKAYGVPKRPQVLQETLSAIAGRNLSAPVVSLPQNDQTLVMDIWENFLQVACLPEAKSMLASYQADPVALEEGAMQDWLKKASSQSVATVERELVETSKTLEEMDVGNYIAMLKSDVKPPLSDKPLYSRIEPQVIVYHEKPLSALYSSIFRVLVRRFLSLLKPNYMINLLKDMSSIREFVQSNHLWSEHNLKYLENDFSKYDKSQGEFVFYLENYIFQQLGMNKDFLRKWSLGHVDCSIRCISLGISLHVRYQRKSGDATTAFGNGVLNIVSVLYAYRGTDVVWGVFMGDDSLVCARTVMNSDIAVSILAEKFNLLAKFFITDAPYFASHFFLMNSDTEYVSCVPDPLKRAQKLSMAVNADDPMWSERYQSALVSLDVYRFKSRLVGLDVAVRTRYNLNDEWFSVQSVADAYATAISTEERFRAMWADHKLRIDF